jgi:hypothetical protein
MMKYLPESPISDIHHDSDSALSVRGLVYVQIVLNNVRSGATYGILSRYPGWSRHPASQTDPWARKTTESLMRLETDYSECSSSSKLVLSSDGLSELHRPVQRLLTLYVHRDEFLLDERTESSTGA